MMKKIWLVAALGLMACSDSDKGDSGATGSDGSDGADGADGGDGDGGTDCTVVASNTTPGDALAHYRDDIAWSLSEADASASVTLMDASGAEVAGSSWADEAGTTVYFTPDAPLSPSSDYSTMVTYCDGAGSDTQDFSTSEVGTPVDCDLTTQGYRVSLADATFVEPATLGSLIGGLLEQDLLMQPVSASETEINIIAAISTGIGESQDYCNPSIEFPPAAFDNPTVSIGPEDTPIDAAGVTITINQLELIGDFSPDCQGFGGGELKGELDARDLAELLEDLTGSTDPQVACDTLAGFGVTCGSCSSDGEPFCVTIIAEDIEATTDASSGVECVPDEDCHAGCPDATSTVTCTCD